MNFIIGENMIMGDILVNVKKNWADLWEYHDSGNTTITLFEEDIPPLIENLKKVLIDIRKYKYGPKK